MIDSAIDNLLYVSSSSGYETTTELPLGKIVYHGGIDLPKTIETINDTNFSLEHFGRL